MFNLCRSLLDLLSVHVAHVDRLRWHPNALEVALFLSSTFQWDDHASLSHSSSRKQTTCVLCPVFEAAMEKEIMEFLTIFFYFSYFFVAQICNQQTSYSCCTIITIMTHFMMKNIQSVFELPVFEDVPVPLRPFDLFPIAHWMVLLILPSSISQISTFNIKKNKCSSKIDCFFIQ